MSASASPLTASVVICAFSDKRRHDTVACVESVLAQTLEPGQVIVVVDHNDELRRWLREQLPDSVLVIANDHAPGLSGARNTGIAASTEPIIAFIDDDAIADPGWLAALCDPLSRHGLVATGGRAVPAWSTRQPDWLPDEFLWVVGCSYEGQPRNGPVRNVLGCTMAFRAELFQTLGGFQTDLGRRNGHPLGCEETELCIRVHRHRPEWRIELVEQALIHHRVDPERESLGYFLARCYYEGVSKGALRKVSGNDATAVERDYVRSVLPRAVRRELRNGAKGAPKRALGRIAAIHAGTFLTILGYARELLTLW